MRLNEYASTRRTRGSYKIPTSVQKSIPIDEIYADGTWRSGEVYSQMWSVSDINYAMQSDDKKQDILAKMGRIYSNIPTDCWAQLCIVSQRMDEISFERDVLYHRANDGLDAYRVERNPKLHELLRPLSDNDIDRAIQDWNGKIESKHAVVRYMKDHARERDTAAWLAHEFDGGDGKTPFAIRPESPEGTALPWPKVQRRIAQLIKEDRFYTQVEQDNLDDVDPIAIREALAQRGIVDGHVVDPEKLDNDPFIQQVMRDVEAISRETAQADQQEQPVPGNSRVPVSDEEYAAARGTVRERTCAISSILR